MGLLEKFDNYHNDRDALTSKELDLLSSGSCYDNVLVKDKIEVIIQLLFKTLRSLIDFFRLRLILLLDVQQHTDGQF